MEVVEPPGRKKYNRVQEQAVNAYKDADSDFLVW